MKQSVKNHLLQWGDRLVEKYTKLSHNRLTKYTIGAILMSGAALVFGLPAIRLEHDANYSYWKALIDYNETNPWGCVVLIVSICAATIVSSQIGYVTDPIAAIEAKKTQKTIMSESRETAIWWCRIQTIHSYQNEFFRSLKKYF